MPTARAHGAPRPTSARATLDGRAGLGRAARARRGPPLGFEQRAVRPPALGALLVRHDRPAEGDRPRPRRHPARAPEEAAPPPRRAGRRPRLLVHDDRLDDVELPGRRAAHAGLDRALRRQPGHPDMGALWDLRRAAGHHLLRHERRLRRRLHEGRRRARARAATSPRCESVGSTGSPLSPEGFDWVYEQLGADTWLFSTSGGTDVCTAFVGGVPTLPVYQRRAAGAARSARDRGLGRGGPAAGRRGRRARAHRADALDAARSSGTTRTASATARPTSTTYPGVWRHGDWIEITDARHGDHLRPLGLDDQPRRRAHGHERDLPRGARRSTRSSTRSSSTSRARAPRAGCRCSSCCARAPSSTTTLARAHRAPACASTARRATCPTRSRDRRGAAHALGQGARGAGQADPDGRRRPSRRRAATRSPTPPRSTGSSSWRASAQPG